MSEVTYTKAVVLVKGESKIRAHLSRGKFTKYNKDGAYTVDGEFGRSGERCANDWHGDYAECKRDFFAYIGEKVFDGYTISRVEVK